MGHTAVRAFHAQRALPVNLSANFICQVFMDDHNLRTLVKNAGLTAVIIDQNVNFS